MSHFALSLLLFASVTLSCLDSAPADRIRISDISNEKEWSLTLRSPLRPPPEAPRHKRSQVEKRRCNTATCVTQRLADFLVRSSNNLGPVYAPTNVGSFAYGKRDIVGLLRRESFDYLQQ
ncbi:islet amyloid polypeptide isoform 1-T2 [Anomaloglossus baeobatrachus]|uniref:islet amyloid polypeptide n=1 Tax=Anomaloglossus baeobatrachus TaxID=238106 RepID=UPI003F4F8DC2